MKHLGVPRRNPKVLYLNLRCTNNNDHHFDHDVTQTRGPQAIILRNRVSVGLFVWSSACTNSSATGRCFLLIGYVLRFASLGIFTGQCSSCFGWHMTHAFEINTNIHFNFHGTSLIVGNIFINCSIWTFTRQ